MDGGGAMLAGRRGRGWRACMPGLLLALALLPGCGGGGGSPGAGNEKLSPGAGNGRLAVVIRGLPPGVAASVRVTGPGEFTASLAQSQEVANLAPGTYEVAAAVVASGTFSFTPDPARQSVQVAGGAPATATVTYTGSTPFAHHRPIHKFGRSPAEKG